MTISTTPGSALTTREAWRHQGLCLFVGEHRRVFDAFVVDSRALQQPI
ncbi:uncharacterized protein METZ01_LOCUS218605 [marine metagenome]|uniref:Uncharacterized protein n=1 Tax=marine metagenome TaxID=408172 RepID=A0A382FUW1_9ZZZZ